MKLFLIAIFGGTLAAQSVTVAPGNWTQAGISLVSSSDPAFAGLASALVPVERSEFSRSFSILVRPEERNGKSHHRSRC
jgi:hypothetical protein